MNLKWNKKDGIENNDTYPDYNVHITVFLAYAQPPETGLSGTLGIAVTSIGEQYCVICRLNTTYGMPSRFSQFSFNHTNDFTKHTGQVKFSDNEFS